MVKNKHLVALTLIAIVGYIVAVLLNSQEQGQSEFQQEAIFKGLSEDSASITSIRIESSVVSPIVAAEKTENGWKIANKHNFLADTEKLSKFVSELINATKIEAKTKIEKNYPRLGLSDIDNQDSTANLVTVASADKQWQVLLGDRATQGRYARINGEQQSWLIDASLNLPENAVDWLQTDIVYIEESDIQSVSISQPEKPSISAIKTSEEQTDFAFENLPQGKKLKYDVILNPLARNVANLALTDIKPIDVKWWDNLQQSHSVIIKTFDGIEISAEFRKKDDDDYWLKLSSIESEQSGFWNTWLFNVSEFTAKQFLKSADDYIEDIDQQDDSESQD